MSPQPIVSDGVVAGNVYDKYETSNPVARRLMAGFDRDMTALLARAEGVASVLEVGCGEGHVTRKLAAMFPGARVVGSDFSPEIVEAARRLHPGLAFEVLSVYELDEKAGRFDLVVASEMLEHLERPSEALERMVRVAGAFVFCQRSPGTDLAGPERDAREVPERVGQHPGTSPALEPAGVPRVRGPPARDRGRTVTHSVDPGAGQGAGNREMKRHLGRILQIAVSIALLALVFHRVDTEKLLASFTRLDPVTVAIAVVMGLTAHWGRTIRWLFLLRRAGVHIPPGVAYRLTLIGVGYGLVTPGRVGEFARILHLDLPKSRVMPSVVWDRVIDVLLLEALAIPAFVFIPDWRGVLLWIYLAVAAITLGGIAVLAHRVPAALVGRLVPRLETASAAWRDQSAGILTSRSFLGGLLGGMFFYALSFGSGILLLRNLVPGAGTALVLSLPVIPLLGNLPVAFAGLGLRENVAATIFGQLRATPALGAVFSLSWFAVMTLIPGLLGFLFVALRTRYRPDFHPGSKEDDRCSGLSEP